MTLDRKPAELEAQCHAAYNRGYADGKTEGEESGYEDGEEVGYNKGCTDTVDQAEADVAEEMDNLKAAWRELKLWNELAHKDTTLDGRLARLEIEYQLCKT